jgi:hypothetical protein
VDHGDYALMGGGLGEEGQLIARLLPNANAGLAAEIGKPFQALVLALTGYQYMVEAPLSGFERFLHRMQTVENFHEG